MKQIKILFILFLGLGIFTSCEKDSFNLDLTQNPNYLREEQADLDVLLNKVQVDFAYLVESMGHRSGELVRIFHMSGRNYESAYTPAQMDYIWRKSYADMFTDMKLINQIAGEKGNTHHIAMTEIMKAYTLISLVDYFGDIPYSETILGAENTNPKLDNGQDVYNAAIDLLDDAIAKLTDPNYNDTFDPELDLYYNKDWDKWVKAANTIKMKALLNTRLVDATAMDKFQAIVDDGNYITSSSDDFQFQWQKSDADPDARHPRYADNYTSTGGDEYMSNSLMDYMSGRNNDAYFNPDHFDPRILFYFYRQRGDTPGKDAAPDAELLECSLQTPPPHYAGFTFCGVANGWWGRDHGNDLGIPPDGFDRTLAGVYPAGGTLDDISFKKQKKGYGFGGEGITPIMLSSWVKFMIAESKMINQDFNGAKTDLDTAMEESWQKVYNFKPRTDRFEVIFSLYLPDINDYWAYFKSQIMSDWDNAATDDEKWEIFAEQFFVALYGNGNDAYNFYRRTGFPKNIGNGVHIMQPNLEPNPGGFIRSFWYPSSLVNRNANVSQKPGVTQQVFWDTNPSSPGFPVAN